MSVEINMKGMHNDLLEYYQEYRKKSHHFSIKRERPANVQEWEEAYSTAVESILRRKLEKVNYDFEHYMNRAIKLNLKWREDQKIRNIDKEERYNVKHTLGDYDDKMVNEVLDNIMYSIGLMDVNHVEVFKDVYCRGESKRDVANRLGVTLNAVTAMLNKVRDMIIQNLNKTYKVQIDTHRFVINLKKVLRRRYLSNKV